MRSYWQRSKKFCGPVNSSIMPHDRFDAITRCLHVLVCGDESATNGHPSYDKLRRVRWVIDEIRYMSNEQWNVKEKRKVDEIMVRYKGKYCTQQT